MRLWQWFNGKGMAKKGKSRCSKPLDPKISQAFSRVKRDIKTLKTGIANINTELARHGEKISENTRLIHDHTSRLAKLEEIVTAAPAALPTVPPQQDRPTNRSLHPTNRLVATNPAANNSSEISDITNLSQQEKNILGIFLTHRDMALSYLDIAKSLDKSPHTIKNQIRQMNMKASLFEKTVDGKNKNRFKLKKHLKIEPVNDSD